MRHPKGNSSRNNVEREKQTLQRNWQGLFTVAVLMLLCAVFIFAHLLATADVSLVFMMALFFVAGFLMLIFASFVRTIPKLFWIFLVSSILFILACTLVIWSFLLSGGFFILALSHMMLNPTESLMVPTLFLALVLGASGLLRIFVALQIINFSGWMGLFLSGLLAVGIAIFITVQLQEWTLFLAGLFFGIDMLCRGLGMAIFAWRQRA